MGVVRSSLHAVHRRLQANPKEAPNLHYFASAPPAGMTLSQLIYQTFSESFLPFLSTDVLALAVSHYPSSKSLHPPDRLPRHLHSGNLGTYLHVSAQRWLLACGSLNAFEAISRVWTIDCHVSGNESHLELTIR